MTEKKFRFLLTCIFAIGASVLIYKKFSKEKLNTEVQTSTSLQKVSSPGSSPQLKDEPKKELINDQRDVNSTEFSAESSKSFASCTGTQVLNAKGLDDFKQNLGLGTVLPENITQKNIIFENNGFEVRYTLTPINESKKWNLHEFKVDTEGLPIPGKKLQAESYEQAMAKVTQAGKGLGKNTVTEEFVNIQAGKHYGTALLVNNSLFKVSVFNNLEGKTLECYNNRCTCE